MKNLNDIDMKLSIEDRLRNVRMLVNNELNAIEMELKAQID